VPVAPPDAEGAGEDEVAEFAVFRPIKGQASFDITRGPAREWIVTGDAVERLFLRWDLENEEAQALVENRLRRMGVISALERAGFEPGDDIEIGGTVFTLDPHA
jgi:GTP-binding protein